MRRRLPPRSLVALAQADQGATTLMRSGHSATAGVQGDVRVQGGAPTAGHVPTSRAALRRVARA
ncbi:hypothetical protein [Humibacter ginsenosidimutans]|uniref:Uncharacterized protein n=1 Tax=Humibacter ginsenosidimutans TaxID=2599293 RepID=A0A5B8M6T5_9MICO|nr:hypothetical protein [Humibacter ginsenosidimutans]QDZ16066.1 hypothetical protein FPZ11_15980 [Humibacter ginsenosidimutans]